MNTVLDEKIKVLDNTKSPNCSCFDEDCKQVKNPFSCWIGDEITGPSDGYCPLMFGAKP